MAGTATQKQTNYAAAMEENQKDVRKMVLDSYHDMEQGKGRDYKEFFSELESRYRNVNV
nr:hypothetical protein [uncultured Blautia sp.]